MNTQISVSVENLAPESGTFQSPTWAGFHNGDFDTFTLGESVTDGLEQLAEDGDTSGLSGEFNAGDFGTDTTVGEADFGPGEIVRQTLTVDPSQPYFSHASMVLPTNDTFIASSSPIRVFDEQGNFIGTEVTVDGTRALDAGTEVNDEVPENTALFGQEIPDTGVDENGVVSPATGFNPVGSGGVLDDPLFANADYTQPDYQFARIRVANLVEGTDRRDYLLGTSAPDDIFAGNGNDVISGKGGNDRIYAGAGRDFISVGSGDDFIEAGSGDDLIFTGGGNNTIDAGEGRDRIIAGSGTDTFILNAGSDLDISNYDTNDRINLGTSLDNNKLDVSINDSDTVISNGDDVLATLREVQVSDIEFV